MANSVSASPDRRFLVFRDRRLFEHGGPRVNLVQCRRVRDSFTVAVGHARFVSSLEQDMFMESALSLL